MSDLLLWTGRLAGLVGFAASALAIVLRLAGTWHVAGLSVGTLLQGGAALMIAGCLAYCARLAEAQRG